MVQEVSSTKNIWMNITNAENKFQNTFQIFKNM